MGKEKEMSTTQSQMSATQVPRIEGEEDEPIDDNICAICLEPYDGK
jgi:hypothetical protein